MIPGYEDLVNKYAVYAVDAPCDCEELFKVTDCGRSDEVWSAIPIEDVQVMIDEAIAIYLRSIAHLRPFKHGADDVLRELANDLDTEEEN